MKFKKITGCEHEVYYLDRKNIRFDVLISPMPITHEKIGTPAKMIYEGFCRKCSVYITVKVELDFEIVYPLSNYFKEEIAKSIKKL